MNIKANRPAELTPADITRFVRRELFRVANGQNLDEATDLLRKERIVPADWVALAPLFAQEYVGDFVCAAVCRTMARGALNDAVFMLAEVHGWDSDRWLRYAREEYPS